MYNESYQVTDVAQSTGDSMIMMFAWFVLLVLWFYFGFMMSKIAYKCGCGENRWWAYIPILNTILLIKMAEKPMWWILILFIPIANIIAYFILWAEASKNAGQSAFWGVMVMFPVINLIALYIIAFNSKKYDYPETPSHPSSTTGGKPPQPSEPTFPRQPQDVQ